MVVALGTLYFVLCIFTVWLRYCVASYVEDDRFYLHLIVLYTFIVFIVCLASGVSEQYVMYIVSGIELPKAVTISRTIWATAKMIVKDNPAIVYLSATVSAVLTFMHFYVLCPHTVEHEV